ncbi:MAG: MetQ/NlpA family ABC transporter substrate-binding protein [Limnochordia bacterium]
MFLEGKESPYVNILVVRAEDRDNPDLKKLADALQSDLIRDFILSTYDGGVVPAF